jgi:hypothetical protein
MALLVARRVNVDLDEAHTRIVEMLLCPAGVDERAGRDALISHEKEDLPSRTR